MNLNLERPLVIYDLEATGLKISQAKIIAIGCIKINTDGTQERFEALVNPMCHLPEEITRLTGITSDQLSNQQPFDSIAQTLKDFMEGCDLAGFNITRFDLPLLAEEYARIGIDFPAPDVRILDAQVIFHTFEERTLSAALQFYCGREHGCAHEAMCDTNATLDVLNAQLERYENLPRFMDALHDFSLRDKRLADFSRLLYFDENNQLRYNFGKYKDELVDNFRDYADWIMREDFPINTKRFLTKYFQAVDYVPYSEDDLPW